MQKVYVVHYEDGWEDGLTRICGVFSTKGKAVDYIKQIKDNPDSYEPAKDAEISEVQYWG